LEEKGPLWLLESAADAMLITDSSGRIVLVNTPAEALFGYPRAELLALSVESLIPPRFRATHPAQRQDYAAHPGSRVMGSGVELYGLRKDGGEFAADVSLSPLEGGYVLATVHDITRRKRAEEALSEQSARLAAIVETAVDAIITIDERGTIDSFNPAAERLFGYARDEVLGKNISQLMPSPYHEEHDGYLAHYLATGEKRIIGLGREVVAQRKDGSTFPIELSVSEMRVGARRMFTGLVHDITQRKQAEERQARLIHELESANEELKNFAYVVSHDLKAPLRAIGSLADWISTDQSAKLDAEGKEHLRLLIQRTRRMDSLIDGILQYSRVGRVREAVVAILARRPRARGGGGGGRERDRAGSAGDARAAVPYPRRGRRRATDHPRRTHPHLAAVPEPAVQRHQVSGQARRPDPRRLRGARPGVGIQRQRQRPGHRDAALQADFPVVSDPRAQGPGGEHRHRPVAGEKNRRDVRRARVDRIAAGNRQHLFLYLAA